MVARSLLACQQGQTEPLSARITGKKSIQPFESYLRAPKNNRFRQDISGLADAVYILWPGRGDLVGCIFAEMKGGAILA